MIHSFIYFWELEIPARKEFFVDVPLKFLREILVEDKAEDVIFVLIGIHLSAERIRHALQLFF